MYLDIEVFESYLQGQCTVYRLAMYNGFLTVSCTYSRALNLVKLGKDLTDPMSLPCKIVNDEKRK